MVYIRGHLPKTFLLPQNNINVIIVFTYYYFEQPINVIIMLTYYWSEQHQVVVLHFLHFTWCTVLPVHVYRVRALSIIFSSFLCEASIK